MVKIFSSLPWRSVVVTALAVSLFWLAVDHQDNSFAFQRVENWISADDIIAAFTIVLAGAAVTTYFTFKRQADIMEKQIALSRDEFNAIHRPQLSVWRFSLRDLMEGVPTCVTFQIRNAGTAEASSIAWRAKIFADSRVPEINNIGPQLSNAIFKHTGIGVPQGHTMGFTAFDQPPTQDDIDQVYNGRLTLHMIGEVVYFDKSGFLRTTGFHRYFDIGRARFAEMSEPDYDYEYEY
jgi:hypothetical protein